MPSTIADQFGNVGASAPTPLPTVPPDLQKYLQPMPPVQSNQTPTIKLDPKATSQQRLMQGLNQGGVAILAPDGKPGFVHGSIVDSFLKENPDFRHGVVMTAPDGTPGLVSRDEADQFLKANPTYKVGQPQTQAETKYGSDEWYASKLPASAISGLSWFQRKINDPLNRMAEEGAAIGREAGTAVGAGYEDIVGHPLKVEPEPGGHYGHMKFSRTPLESQQLAETEHPALTGVSRAVGSVAGGAVADPRNWPFLASGAARPILQKLISSGFAVQMGKGTVDAVTQLHDNWDRMTPADRYEMGTKAGLTAAMAAASGAHAVSDAVPVVRQAGQDAGQAIVKPVKYLAQKGRDIRSAVSVEKAGPVESATMAFRPRNSKYKWQQEVQSALPDMRRASDSLGIDPEKMTIQDAHRATSQAKRDVWREYSEQFADPNAADTVDTTPIAGVIRSTVTQRMEEQNPTLADRIHKVADTYEGRQLNLGDIEDRMHELNNETAAIEAKYPAQKMAAQSDPSNAYIFAERQALRNLADSKMNELSGPGANQLRARYGALKSVEDVIQRRIPVVERQSPMPISKLMAQLYGVGKIAKGVVTGSLGNIVEGGVTLASQARAAKLNDPDFLTQQAFRKTIPSRPIPPAPTRMEGEYVPQDYVPPRNRMIRGLLPSAFRMPEQMAPPSSQVETVGMSPAAEGNAYQKAFERNPAPFLRQPSAAPGSEIATPSVLPRIFPRAPVIPEAAVTPVNAPEVTPQPVAPKLTPRVQIARPKSAEIKSRGDIGGNYGSDTVLNSPAGNQPARYRVVEASTLTPSHSAKNFAKNPKYPAGIQERAYDTSREAQARVIQQAQEYDPSYTINTNPDAVNGPPIITPDGIVLGGNSRTMSTQRLYNSGRGNRYKDALLAQAGTFGISPDVIKGMKYPMLVREVAQPANAEAMRRLGSDLNKSMTGALGVSERAVTAGKAISQESLSRVAGMMDGIGAEASLRDLMRERGNDLVSLLVKDGAITERERPQFVDSATGGLSEEGKTFVERALLGSVVDDPRLMDAAPKSVLNKLDSSLAAISSLAPRTYAYNILPLLRAALREHAAIASRGSNVETYLNQTGLFGGERSPAIDALVRLFADRPTVVREKLRQFSQDAGFDKPEQGTFGLGEEVSPSRAFNDAFGTKLTDDQLADAIERASKLDPILGDVK
jgi:hypothetical protein